MLRPYRLRQAVKPFQQRHRPAHHAVRQPKRRNPGKCRWQHRTQQGERYDDQAHQRNSKRVGDGRHQRYLLEQGEQHRDQAYGHRPLDLAVFHQPVRRLEPVRRDIQDQGHRAERQPEAGRHDGPRVRNQHAEQCDAKYLAGRKITVQPKRNRYRTDHVHGALSRYCKTG